MLVVVLKPDQLYRWLHIWSCGSSGSLCRMYIQYSIDFWVYILDNFPYLNSFCRGQFIYVIACSTVTSVSFPLIHSVVMLLIIFSSMLTHSVFSELGGSYFPLGGI